MKLITNTIHDYEAATGSKTVTSSILTTDTFSTSIGWYSKSINVFYIYSFNFSSTVFASRDRNYHSSCIC